MNLRRIFTEAQQDGKIVSIHWGPHGEDLCAVGYVHTIGSAHVILKSTYSDGADGGYELRSFSDIHRIDVGGQFERKVDFLVQHRGSVLREKELPERVKAASNLEEAIAAMAKMDMLVEVTTETEDDPHYGFVEAADADGVQLRSINNYGEEDGTVYLTLEKIECININTHVPSAPLPV